MTTQEEKEQILFVGFEVNEVLGLGELKLIPSRIVTNLGDYDVDVIGHNDYLVYHKSSGGYISNDVFNVSNYCQNDSWQQGMFWRAMPDIRVKLWDKDVKELDSSVVPEKWRDFEDFTKWYEVGDKFITVNEVDSNIIWCSTCKLNYDSDNYVDEVCDHVWWCKSSSEWNTPDAPCDHKDYDSCSAAYDNDNVGND